MASRNDENDIGSRKSSLQKLSISCECTIIVIVGLALYALCFNVYVIASEARLSSFIVYSSWSVNILDPRHLVVSRNDENAKFSDRPSNLSMFN